MIDTIKIYAQITKNIYYKIRESAIYKTSYSRRTGQLFYEIVTGSLEGSYSSSLGVRTDIGSKYGFVDSYVVEIEGSYHKLMLGYNSHNGFYNLQEIVQDLINAVSYDFGVPLPPLEEWYLQRVDVAICYDLGDNAEVRRYINNLSLCSYPRRNIKHFQDQSIYSSGSTTTLKIYNKKLEFRKHDMKKMFNSNFSIENYLKEIDGFVRFECEIKKKKLKDFYKCDHIFVISVKYEDLKEVWSEEFMKLLKYFDSDLELVRKKEDVERRIATYYANKQRKSLTLYNFYLALMIEGKTSLQKKMSSTTFYRNMQILKELHIDTSQKYTLVDEGSAVEFNPFEWKEVV